MSFKENIVDLIKDSWKYQYSEINNSRKDNESNKPKLFFTYYQFIIIGLTIVFLFLAFKGFSTEFAGYAISGLSLFVGVFFTFVLTLYNKFQSVDFEKYKEEVNVSLMPIGVRLKNFYTKVTVLSLYSILLALLCIVLLSLSLIFDLLQFDISLILLSTRDIDLFVTLKSILVLLYRGLTLYFLLDFILITIYLIGNFYDFFISEYKQVKLKKN